MVVGSKFVITILFIQTINGIVSPPNELEHHLATNCDIKSKFYTSKVSKMIIYEIQYFGVQARS